MSLYEWQKLTVKEIFEEVIFAIEDLKINKLRRFFFAIQQSQEKFVEYTFVIGSYYYKVQKNVKFHFVFVVVINFDVSFKQANHF